MAMDRLPHIHYHLKEKQEPSSAKQQIPSDKNNHAAKAAVTCFNCGGLGHYARDCKKLRKDQVYIQAAHTEVADQPSHGDGGDEPQEGHAPSECGSQWSMASQGAKSGDDHFVEVNVYENDWYEWDDDTDNMFTMRGRANFWPSSSPGLALARNHGWGDH